MDKRTKILLSVLAVLVLAGGGYYGYLFMTAKEAVKEAVLKPPAAMPAPKPTPPAPAPAIVPAPAAKGTAPAPSAKAPAKAPAPATAPPPAPLPKATAAATQKQAAPQQPAAQKAPAAPVKPAPAAAAAPQPSPGAEQKEAVPGGQKTVYSSLGKRDPFMSPLEVPKVYPRVLPSAKPLEKAPTESIIVKAIMWNEKGYRALVVTPDGRGYTVKVGDTIGNKQGKIMKMTEKRIYVTEKITDILGDVETRNIVLKLHKEAE